MGTRGGSNSWILWLRALMPPVWEVGPIGSPVKRQDPINWYKVYFIPTSVRDLPDARNSTCAASQLLYPGCP
jgi:hypothetical protein